ncbi:MAG: type II toxin-antitoxin system RelE/ParE family toxin [Desulfomonile sp.]
MFQEQGNRKAFSPGACFRLPADIRRVAFRKLRMLHHARVLKDVALPPGNRLEVLIGKRRGQCSIRVNDQWRICFAWDNGNAYNVELVDYH